MNEEIRITEAVTSIHDRAYLTIINGPRKGAVFPLAGEPVVLGSDAEISISLPGSKVACRHAGIRLLEGVWEIQDLSGSKVFVNDIPTTHRTLGGGEIFRLGEHELHFSFEPPTSMKTVEPADRIVMAIDLERGESNDQIQHLNIISGPGFLIGRSPDNDLSIKDPRASRRHCRIEVVEGEVMITDLGSLNGTHLDGNLIQQAILRPGDLIAVGKTTLRCRRT
ncbi:FHA domain-containing protein [Planctomycetota bacterium]|nr:FHA domain-containing protein [Planctomycetota bacterium]MDC0648184.1 FHA domain-containing protein [bacterium]MDC0853012.1 FHA domain-containing protein [Planctomycetota bacterium]